MRAAETPTHWRKDLDDALRYRGRLVVPSSLCEEVLKEFHCSRLVVYPGQTKIYYSVHMQYWWRDLKKAIEDYIRRCLTYQQVKVEHMRSSGELQPLLVPQWKWDHITMDFVTGLPLSKGSDTIWVIVDRLTNTVRFLLLREGTIVPILGKRYVAEVVRLHGVTLSIVSN